ncbi:hypothetical protein CL1_0236 [Thermococcus cleftensis]|uniref:TRP-repeat-containing protein n=1 Tax=Thermococcus cleftensis (strain DSM 27260 / KACC 17922 / CL1) TaxID=163003 RepID=I3ZRW4_THECF|nr:hypothetical protein CL1_0236 [Thermococcus cleftensis]
MEAVELYVSKGDYRGALKSALEITDPIKRLIALTEVLTAFPRDEVLSHMLDALESTGGAPERALAYSILGRALYTLDRDRDAETYLENAIVIARSIDSPRVRGEVLAGIARNLVLSDRYRDGLELFRGAVELLQASRGLSSAATSSLIKVARLIEKSADEIPNEMALEFYGLARDVYASIFFKLQARYIEDKMRLIRNVLKRGKAAVEELLEMGEVELAISMMRFLPLEGRAIAMFELAYWLFLHEQPRLGRRVFDDALEIVLVGKFRPTDRELGGIARRFLRIGFLEEPLVLAGVIRDDRIASELLGEVALAYARWGDRTRARSIAEGIRDESVKNRVLEALEGESYVGHEQGLPLTGGGEIGGAVPEDGGGREVQGEVEQEGSDSTGEGDDSRDTGDEVQLRGAEGAD